MALITCSNCGKEIPDKVLTCHECGSSYFAIDKKKKGSEKRGGYLKTLIAVSSFLIVLGVAGGMMSEKMIAGITTPAQPNEAQTAPSVSNKESNQSVPSPEAASNPAVSPASGPKPESQVKVERKFLMKWEEITNKKVTGATTKRDRLYVTIALVGVDYKTHQEQLVDTIRQAAETYHTLTDNPIIIVKLLELAPAKNSEVMQLAYAVYIPDQKGFDGNSRMNDPWGIIETAPCGFTAKDLEYLQLFETMYDQYINQDEDRGDELHNAICKKLGGDPDKFNPVHSHACATR